MDFFTTDNELKMLLALAALKVVNEYLDRWGVIDRISPFFNRFQAVNATVTEQLDFVEGALKDRELDLNELRYTKARVEVLHKKLTEKEGEIQGDA